MSLELIIHRKNKKEGKDFPTLGEIRLLKDAVRKDYASRDAIIVDLILSTGLNPQEVANLNYGDLSRYKLQIQEGGKRTVFFGEEFQTHLSKYLKSERKTDGPLVDNSGIRITKRTVQNVVKKFIARAGINSAYSARSLRHAYAYHLYLASLDLDVVHSQLGAKDIQFKKTAAESIETRTRTALCGLYQITQTSQGE